MSNPLPTRLRDFRDRHTGETIVVCGCGCSAAELPEPERWVTIGVNDLGRLFTPTYLVVLNPASQFKGDRFPFVAASRAQALFTHLDPARSLAGLAHPHVVRFRLGERGGSDLGDPEKLPYTRNSPYVAACLAAFLGARRIGLIGVDFTDDHFFAATGRHPLFRELPVIDREYGRLAAAFAARGIELVNLSRQSRLTTLPKLAPAEFLAGLAAPPLPVAASRRSPMPSRPRAANPPFRATDSAVPAADPPRPVAGRRLAGRVAIQRAGGGLVGACLNTLATSATHAGFEVSREPLRLRHRPDTLCVVWNGRTHHGVGPTLYCEHGWLPRTAYQISPRGINASSHLAPFRWDGRALADAEREAVLGRLAELRAEAGPAPAREAFADLPAEFLLVPLQVEGDTNLERHAPPALRRMQGLIDHLSAANPPWPIVFKQHPADLRRGARQLGLRIRRKQDRLYPAAGAGVHELLRLPGCQGIVSINSNVVHDGLLWGVPAVVLGANVWPRDGRTPFLVGLPEDWRTLPAARLDRARELCREAYAGYLLRSQWSREDLADVDKVEALLRRQLQASRALARPVAAASRASLQTRAAARAVARSGRPRTSEPRVNVVARDHGWLFEDLKRHFSTAANGTATVVASELPRRDADAWVFLRAAEAVAAPDPARAVVQIHDLFDGDLYRRGERRAAVQRCGALSLTHPRQQEILAGHGFDLTAKRLLLRPLGAAPDFRPSAAPELPPAELPGDDEARFTVGWVGRPVLWQGEDVKRAAWFVEALRRMPPAPPPLAALLLGERLGEIAAELHRADIPVRYLDRRELPHARYPEHYRQLDALVVTARLAPGPNCLFEALASGVPVVSTRVGWAEELIRDGENGFLADSVDEIAAALDTLRAERATWLAKKEAIRASLGDLTLDSWVQANLKLALELAA